MTPRLFMQVVSLQARTKMSYRVDFWLNSVVGFAVQMTVVWFLWTAIFAESGSEVIGGFAFHGMVFYYVITFLLAKLVRISDMAGGLSDEIYQGHLTRYLVYPVAFFPYKFAQGLGELPPALIQLLLFGATFTLLVPIPPEIDIGWQSVLMCAACIGVAHLMHFVMISLVELVAFWADNVWSLNVMTRMTVNILGGVLLPLTLFPDWGRDILALLPFQYLFYQPVMVLIGKVGVLEWLQGLGITMLWVVLLACCVRVVWRRGNLQYTGVGI